MFLFGAEEIPDEGSGVDPHEGDQRAEVEEFSAALVADQESADEGDNANKNNVVARDVVFGINRSEEFLGNSIAASHAVKQSRGAELRAHAGTDVGNQNRKVQQME